MPRQHSRVSTFDYYYHAAAMASRLSTPGDIFLPHFKEKRGIDALMIFHAILWLKETARAILLSLCFQLSP